MSDTGYDDHENYKRLSVPFETSKEADKAIEEFYEEVQKLRNRIGLRDVHIIVTVNVLQEGERTGSIHLGNSVLGLNMCLKSASHESSRFYKILTDVMEKE